MIRKPFRAMTLALVGLMLAAASAPADLVLDASMAVPAGVRRHDVADAVHTGLAAGYPSVGALTWPGFICSGVLIGPNCVLTAAHCLDTNAAAGQYNFAIGGNNYTGAVKHILPAYLAGGPNANARFQSSIFNGTDIAVLILSQNVVGVAAATLNTNANETGKLGTNVGFGNAGTGLTGQVNGTSGTKRAGENMVDLFGSAAGISGNLVLQDFDSPIANTSSMGSATPLTREYLIAQGDSGGGLFIDFGSGPVVAAIHSVLFDVNQNGRLSDYGDIAGSTRVSQHLDFIRSVWVPEPSSVVLAAIGGLGLLVVARRRRLAA